MDTSGHRMEIAGRNILVFPSDVGGALMVVLNTFENEGKDVHDAVISMTEMPFTLVCVQIDDWNSSMSPWSASIGMKGGDFTGAADIYLDDLIGIIIPSITESLGIQPGYDVIAGYSMAGLFALHSLFCTDLFSRAVCASGSLWFPGIVDYIDRNDMKGKVDRVVLSLGDREHRTRNVYMKEVLDNTQRIVDILSERCDDVRFRMDEGNHFNDPVGRIAKGIVSILE